MIYGLTPDQEKIIKARQAESRLTEIHRKWAYNDANQGVLVENEAEYEEIKDFFNLASPECDNKDVKVLKFGEAKKEVNKAKRDIERAKKKTAPKKKEVKVEE